MTMLDKALFVIIVSTTSGAAQGSPNWEINQRTDPFTDVVSYDVMKLADNFVGGIFFGCKEGEPLAAGIFWGKEISSNNQQETEVEIRVGDNPAFSMALEVTNNSASGTEQGGREMLDNILDQMESSKEMIARTTGDLASAFVRVDLTGLDRVAAQLDQDCN